MPDDEEEVARELRARAITLLARREHSRRELERKLARVTTDRSLIERTVSRLAGEDLQSDERFAAALVRSRSERGYGPLRLLAELREHDLAPALVEGLVDIGSPDWRRAAAAARTRRFGEALPQSPRELARQMRFLQYRGFTGEQARIALRGRGAGDD